ncbi:uncharacterized protein LOC144110909 [Amblyomma americanum]
MTGTGNCKAQGHKLASPRNALSPPSKSRLSHRDQQSTANGRSSMASRSTSRNRQNSSKNSSRLTWADRVSGNATRHPPPPQSSQKIRETRNSGPCATRAKFSTGFLSEALRSTCSTPKASYILNDFIIKCCNASVSPTNTMVASHSRTWMKNLLGILSKFG